MLLQVSTSHNDWFQQTSIITPISIMELESVAYLSRSRCIEGALSLTGIITRPVTQGHHLGPLLQSAVRQCQVVASKTITVPSGYSNTDSHSENVSRSDHKMAYSVLSEHYYCLPGRLFGHNISGYLFT